jgi:spore coat polysaccharide biosynthesis protein SpsF
MIACFIQARVSSTRLPGKVLKPILGRPMLAHQIERVRMCRTIDRIVVVTSDSPDDRAIIDMCRDIGVDVFAGSLENVLDRFYCAAEKYKPDHIVRLTGDCPLIDPEIIDRMISLYLGQDGEYGTNCMPPTFPDGLDAEIFTYKALGRAKRDAVLPYHLEHISLFFEEQPEQFKIVNLRHSNDLSHMRWTVDEPEDFEFVKHVYESIYPENPMFTMADVLDFLAQNPELVFINGKFMRNEGVIRSKARYQGDSNGER